MIDFKQEESAVRRLADEIRQADLSLESEERELSKAKKTHEHTLQAQEVLQLLAQAVQQQAHERIARVVSSCLAAVFEDPYEFEIQFDRKRGKTEASLRFLRGELNVDPLTASGGGVVDVAAFALRVVCLVMHRPRLSSVVVLDEPFKYVSASYQEGVREMLEQLAEDMGVQIIFVSHNENLATGKIVEL